MRTPVSAGIKTKSATRERQVEPRMFVWKGSQALADLYTMSPFDRVGLVKRGIPAQTVVRIANFTGQPKERVMKLLGLPRSTVDRKARSNQALPIDQGERVLGLLKLVGQVQVMIEQSGDPKDFDAARWVSSWLGRPSPALGNRAPGELMDTAEGQQVVANILASARSGVFA